MSRQSVKTAKRSTKTAGRPVKKAAKSARASDNKASKSARSPVGKTTHPALVASIAASRSASKAALEMIRTASPPVQPLAAHEIALTSHKYQVGELVYYTSPTFGRAAATGNYTVVKLLPSEGDDYQYRIKSSGEAFERVAKESQLDKI